MRRVLCLLLLAVACRSSDATEVPSTSVVVAGGLVRLGSPADEPCREADEKIHEVEVGRFTIDKYEVTRAEFSELMSYDPSHGGACPRCPVERVTHHEAAAYCNARSRRAKLNRCYSCTGKQEGTRCRATKRPCDGFRLPAEDEWEAAARAATRTALPSGDVTSCMTRDEAADRMGWYKANSGGRTHAVGSKSANPIGLHDMAGNVYEWTDTWYGDGERVLRGGSWYHNAEHTRSANRAALPPDKRLSWAGFRCVRSS